MNFSELLKGNVFFKKFYSKSCNDEIEDVCGNGICLSHEEQLRLKLDELIDNLQRKQHERSIARQDESKMHNSFYAEEYAYPWLAYIELSDIVIFLEDYVKIFRYMGLIDILQAKSENKQFGLLPQLKRMTNDKHQLKFFVFVCGDFYIACLLGSRHILVADKDTYDVFFIDAGLKCQTTHVDTTHIPPYVRTLAEIFEIRDYFDLCVNCSSKKIQYRVRCKIKSKHLSYDVSTLSLSKEEFIPLVKELRQKFFLLERTRTLVCERNSFFDRLFFRLLKNMEDNLTKLVSLNVKIPETLLTC